MNDELLKARMTINKFNYSVNRYEEKPGFDIAKKITEPKHVSYTIYRMLNDFSYLERKTKSYMK